MPNHEFEVVNYGTKLKGWASQHKSILPTKRTFENPNGLGARTNI